MFSRVLTTTLCGIEAGCVQVETQIFGALRRFNIVGLPDGVIREAKDRVRCAIENSGFSFPKSEVIVSLAPASLPKLGAGLDLAIAISILAADGQIKREAIAERVFLGELALDGSVRRAPGALAAACFVRDRRAKRREFFSSWQCASVAAQVKGISSYGLRSLHELVGFLNGEIELLPLSAKSFAQSFESGLGFSDVIGQEEAKRALEIAACGGHNFLMLGPPGSGKSMLAERFIHIMPPLSSEEALEVAKIYAVSENKVGAKQSLSRQDMLIRSRPFRSPHHSASSAALIGGGALPMPGEISLSHRGVLFLDELAQFKKDALDSLRESLETQKVNISRAKGSVTFPADFTLIAAMNPPETKFVSSGEKVLRGMRNKGRNISSPFLDRMDLQLWVPSIKTSEFLNTKVEDNTEAIRKRVNAARLVQKERYQSSLKTNARMKPKEIEKFCSLKIAEKKLLERAADKFSLTTRGCTRVLKVSRSISDLSGSKTIEGEHLMEALSYRILE